MSFQRFMKACVEGDEHKAKSLISRNPNLIKKRDAGGNTGLNLSICGQHHSLTRWLLTLPGLDANNISEDNACTALHLAVVSGSPMDIVITLVKLSGGKTLNQKTNDGFTALDWALDCGCGPSISASLYLSWLGAECKEEKRVYREVTLQTWVEEGCLTDAQFWAVATDDVG